jgi:glutamine amidotransferase
LIAVIDYGAGNLRSVVNALEAIGQKPLVTSNPADLAKASAIVLPGVGAFGDGMESLRRLNLIKVLNEEVLGKKKPYLGICLGLQFLAQVSFEQGTHDGLGWINGKVVRLEPCSSEYRVPHIGWNDLQINRDSLLFEDLEDSPVFYFVHSYRLVVEEEDRDVVTATCWHGQSVTAAVQKDNIFAVQFHPEKSQRSGLNLLSNFVRRWR